MIPTSSNYPENLDTDDNLFHVHDSMRMKLVEDYEPGDTSIQVEGDFLVFNRFPPTGLITLTEQCSEIKERAISFYYNNFNPTTGVISGLELLEGFKDVRKPKNITNVVMQVMDKHHNNIKNSLIAIENFIGVKGTIDNEPMGETLEGRTNFLRKIVLQPKAWFTADKRTGNVPLEVEFKDLSFRLGTDGTSPDVTLTWDFGDQSTSIVSVISETSVVPNDSIDVYVRDIDGGTIKKVFQNPGLYTVKLTVENNFGSDTVIFEDFINARIKAPKPAIIRFVENTSTQDADAGVPPNGPFETFPKIRSPINNLIQIEIETGENPSIPGYSYAGELLNEDEEPVDPVSSWTWFLGDDLEHPNSRNTKASYSIGGVYDLKLRVDTSFGAYRITTYENSIDIIEITNLWLWNFQSGTTVRSYEYGLISETFKTTTAPTLTLSRNNEFLNGLPEETRQKREFARNVGFAQKSNVGSGYGGTSLMYYATGRASSDPVTTEKINVVEFDGFSGTYVTRSPIVRQWNWANLNATESSYFIFGTTSNYLPNTSPTNVIRQSLSLETLTVTNTTLTNDNYLNGAAELTQDVCTYDGDGDSVYGNFSVYRTAWKDNTGYILRNAGVGPFFRIRSFYRTEGTAGTPFINIRKLQDIQGPTKLEGQLINMSEAVFFLNNSGSVSRFSSDDNIWKTGGPGVNSLLYRKLQDSTVSDFDNQENTLMAVSDNDKRAYLSFDYSVNAFIKFNEIDLTFVTLGNRPDGTQFLLGVF